MPQALLLPDEISFSASISACEKAGKWQMALQLLSHMFDVLLLPDEINFNACISACEKGEKLQIKKQLEHVSREPRGIATRKGPWLAGKRDICEIFSSVDTTCEQAYSVVMSLCVVPTITLSPSCSGPCLHRNFPKSQALCLEKS